MTSEPRVLTTVVFIIRCDTLRQQHHRINMILLISFYLLRLHQFLHACLFRQRLLCRYQHPEHLSPHVFHIISSSSNTYQPHGGVSRLHIQSFMLIIILIAKLVILPILTIIVVLSVIIVESGNLASLFIAAAWSFFTASPPSVAKECQHKVEARDAVSPLDDFAEASTCSKIFCGSERAPALDGVGFWALVHTLSKVRPNTRCHHRLSVAGLLVLSCCWFVPITRIFYQVMPETETRANTQSLRHAQKVEFEMACGRRWFEDFRTGKSRRRWFWLDGLAASKNWQTVDWQWRLLVSSSIKFLGPSGWAIIYLHLLWEDEFFLSMCFFFESACRLTPILSQDGLWISLVQHFLDSSDQ